MPVEPNQDDPRPTTRPATREERLAAKLRENLKRRKAQARAIDGAAAAEGPADMPSLPKAPPKS